MNVFYDANEIYEAGTKAIKSSPFKYGTQLYEMNHLLETAKIQEGMMNRTFKFDKGRKHVIKERGKARFITSDTMRVKSVNHLVCDNVLMPATEPYLIYDNGASRKGKGVSFHRQRFEYHLHQYYNRHGSNEGYILLIDFSGYYANILHEKCMETLLAFLQKSLTDEEELATTEWLLRELFKTFEVDVSRFSDEEIESFYKGKVDPMLNEGINPITLPGRKMLKKGVDIGSQPSQNIGIVYPYRIDNYAKIVKGVKAYARYTDDFHAIHESKEFLEELLEGIRRIAEEYGLIINEKKTRIVKLDSFFRHLQIGYSLQKSGRLIRKINPKAITRERRKLKAYKRKLDKDEMPYEDIENAFKGWMGGNYKRMSRKQITNMFVLYYQLFERRPTWKKRHGRLRWLMVQSLKTFS